MGGERLYPYPQLEDFSQTATGLNPERGVFRTLSAPVTLQWELTHYCNHNCIQCYNYWRQENFPQRLDVGPNVLNTYRRASEEIIKNKAFHVTVTGGEPLATIKWSYPFLQHLANNDVGISLNSNLTMLTREKVKMLKDIGVRSILTSLMSADAALNDRLANFENAHRKTVKGIKMALSEGFWVAVNMVVTKANLSQIYDTARFVKALGITSFAATKASTPINCSDFSPYQLDHKDFQYMIDELLRVKNELGLNTDSLEFYPMCFFNNQETRDFAGNRICNAGKTACTIGSEGEIRPCSHASQVYGSVMEEGGLQKVWLNLSDWRDTSYIPIECNPCDLRNVCRGGCRTEAFATRGNLKASDPYCVFNRPPLKMMGKEEEHIGLDENLVFHPGIKIRNEDFGGIMFVTPARWSAVTRPMLSFYKEHTGVSFTSRQLAEALDVAPDAIKPTVNILSRKILVKREEV